MAGKGGRIDLSTLTSSVGAASVVDGGTGTVDGLFRTNVPLRQLIANPRNPRSTVGDLDDLESIKDRQLQPAVVVSRAAWLNLYPDDAADLGDAKWIVVNGCRRLAAAAKYGRDGLDVIIRDSLAGDAATILWAAIAENIDRRDFDIIEEARAVDLLTTEAGSGAAAAERLGRTKAWVSQRRALLKLAPDLQDKLRNGELAVREARNLARVPLPEQIAKWQAAQEQQGRGGADDDRRDRPDTSPAQPEAFVRAFRRLRAEPATVATAAREIFTEDELCELVELLTNEQSS